MIMKPQVKRRSIFFSNKRVLFYCLLFFPATNLLSQKGLSIKVSLGPGYTMESSKLNDSGFAIVSKNHAIAWGISDHFALQIGEFGGLTKQKVGVYNYINLHAYGIGFSYKIFNGIKLSILGAKSELAFAKKWWESSGDDGGNGYGLNISVDKEWFFAKKWSVRLGPQLFWIKTEKTEYEFFNISLNASIAFYLNPMK